MNTGSKVILGVLAGVAAGAVLGILFAPDKGEETRKKISKGSKEAADNLKQKFGDLVDTVVDKLDTVKAGASDLFEQGKSKMSDVKNAMKTDISEAMSAGKNGNA